MAMILLPLLAAMLACEDDTITIERTEDGAVVRSTGSNDPAATRSSGPAEPTATPRPRVDFPPDSDGAALTALYDAAGGESWRNSDGWLYVDDLSQWHGVTTDAEGRVTELDLGGNGLIGELPDELGILTGLTELDLRTTG